MASVSPRAPRGTRILSQAFFEAAEAIQEEKRPAAMKAALASIRLELKAKQLKAKIARARMRAAAGKRPIGRPAKIA